MQSSSFEKETLSRIMQYDTNDRWL